ncbi:ABC transporter ATP-binding protein [Oceanobacillus alkalisoli]|uniref:ABC transporter ATP-binding protein n=1 Tax=Oceanobacillus alkalisoli TaxID=2925113 RepID=UPI001EF0CB9E|nr:ABC transporter ATP-binding protein [Oceanobacillus alkalisoli]MCF3942021.1 ABC transporter ATP-binding protein [Oceanobacillus alkalisoli]MCG5102026.1 ABC transporter ATP-binding protein [Oceanobacillus alkalisoli]
MTLIIDHVTKRFGEFTAVNQLNLTIPKEEVFGFLGGNGAGKTTTFRMLLGLLDKTEGEITWNGETIDYNTSNLIGYLPEERGLYPKLTVKNQITYLAKLRGMEKKEILPELEKWLDRFKVPEYMNKKIEELSKGNQQKIQFISAVIHQPELLVLDEPFSGLDPINVEMLKEAVLDLKDQGTTIVFSSHQMSHVEELCQYLCILQKGRPVVQGALREIKRSFGKKNLRINADFSLEFLAEFPGVVKYRRVNDGCDLQILNEDVSQDIFRELQGKGFIRKFELEEPSLNDIFIEKVGASYE